MKPTNEQSNEQLYQSWITSIVSNNMEKMRYMAEDRDFYEGWINTDSYEIDFTLRQDIKKDHGDYYTEPVVTTSGYIRGEISIYSASDKITIHDFVRDFKD